MAQAASRSAARQTWRSLALARLQQPLCSVKNNRPCTLETQAVANTFGHQRTTSRQASTRPLWVGFGWLVDVIVFGCLWGISQVSRLLGTHLGNASLLKIVVFVLLLLLLLYAFYFVFVRFVGVIRWALNRIAYALGVILFSAAVVSGVFASAGLVSVLIIWVMGNLNLAMR